jgi:hypothetical protein
VQAGLQYDSGVGISLRDKRRVDFRRV